MLVIVVLSSPTGSSLIGTDNMNKFNLFSKDYDHEHPVNQLTTVFVIMPIAGLAAVGVMWLPMSVAHGVIQHAVGVENVRSR